MVSQSSILFLLAFSVVAVSARHFDRRAPDAPGETTDTLPQVTFALDPATPTGMPNAQAADQTQASRETFNKVLPCTDDKMKTPNIPSGTTAKPGQSPLSWVDAFVKCIEMYYSKSGQAQDPATGQAAFRVEEYSPNGQASFGEQTSANRQTAPGEQTSANRQTAPDEETFANR
ncbi:hypothetical protein [Absidia glauca]|uniref:Secreted protein n=1 Tax=Absidia glauca TaxID=4829 RepID=A0A168Q7K3_ABSGL|nr:hypothetical protein [Absidia glauca]